MTASGRTDLLTRKKHKPHVSKLDIRRGLAAVGIEQGDLVFAHSSLSAFGYVEGGADAVVDALLEAVGPGGTVVLPTFTWGAFHNKTGVVFDVANTPCETGRIPETFRRRPGVRRGEHTCHSVAALGPHSDHVLGEGISGFGKGSAFDRIYELDSWYVMLGVTFQSCTALHTVEELLNVPYRAYRDFSRSVVLMPDGSRRPSRAIEFLRQDNSYNDFAKMEEIFDREGILQKTTVGEARIINARVRSIMDITRKLMEEDIGFLSGQRD